IDVAVQVRIFKAVVDALSGVVLYMDARHADALGLAVDLDLDPAVFGQGLIVLRNLVALRQIRVEVILTGEDGTRVHVAIQRQSRLNGEFHGLAAKHRQRARQSQANRADMSVRRRAETRGTPAKDLGARGKLDVHLQPDDRLVFSDGVR